MFKGKFIYIGVGSLLLGLLSTMVVFSTVGLLAGAITAFVTVGGGLTYSALMQRKGLHIKDKSYGVYIVKAKYNRRS
jgi:hypothetical protein